MSYANYINPVCTDAYSNTGAHYNSPASHSNQGCNAAHSDYHSGCTKTCGIFYSDHTNSRYLHSDYGCNNHTNNNSGYKGSHVDQGLSNHNNKVGGVAAPGFYYNNHANTPTSHSNGIYCTQYYKNHNNGDISAPAAYSLSIKESDPDKWTDLRSAVADIKNLHKEITKLSRTKVQSTGAPITNYEPTPSWNADTNFVAGKPAKVEQINETISQVNALWTQIKGGSSGLTTKQRGDYMRRQDYKDIIKKAQELASTSQPPAIGYVNHYNNGNNSPACVQAAVSQTHANANVYMNEHAADRSY